MTTAAEQQPEVYEIDVPLVDNKPPLTSNQRLHWRRKAALTRYTRYAVAWKAKALRLGPCTHIAVQLHYAPGDRRGRRDDSNLMPTQKAAVDGIVDARIVEDDTRQWVTEHMPEIHPGPGVRRLWLTIKVEAR